MSFIDDISFDKILGLIDADVLVYRVGFGSQTTFHKVVNKELYDKLVKESYPTLDPTNPAFDALEGKDWSKITEAYVVKELKKKKYADECVGPFTKKGDAKDALEMFKDSGLEAVFVSETIPTSVEAAKKKMDSTIAEIMQETRAEVCMPILSGKENYRVDVATLQPYKGTRSGSRPIHYQMLRDYLISDYEHIIVSDGCEADDVLSMILWKAYLESEGFEAECMAICASIDKDLLNTPGWHYNIVKREMEFVTSCEADRKFWYQMLIGDGCDNIPGVSKVRKIHGLKGGLVGPVKANKVLDACEEQDVDNYYKSVRALYLEAVLGDEDLCTKVMTEIGTLLWMQRYENEVYGLPIIEEK